MNFDGAERIQLIDISSEDHFLIDSHLDSTSFDLRLSVSVETQKELQSDHKSGVHPGTKDRVPSLAKVERKNLRLERGKGDSSGKECIARKSLAWDQSFFTSAGFLELDELCLVNQGFKNLKVSSSHDVEAGKGKVCHGRNLSHKPSSGAGSRQKIQSSMKAKLVSPSKMVPMQSSKRQEMTTGRSEAFAGVVARSHLVQNTSSRKESLKSTRIMGQSSASTEHIKKPPLRATSKSGLATSIPVGISPYKSSDKSLTCSLLNSQETQGSQSCGMKEADPQDSEALNFKGHRNNQQYHSCIKQSPLSSKASSLRQPSQKIGFFDMKPETVRLDQDGMKHPNKGKLRSSQPSFKKQTHSLEFEEKENLFHPDDTVIELELKKKNSPTPSQMIISNGSSTKKGHSGQCSTSSKKPVSKIQRSVQKTLLSPIRAPRTPFLSKLSPWKKSAAF